MLETSLAEGPQIVTRYGKETAVLVAIEQWRKLERLALRLRSAPDLE